MTTANAVIQFWLAYKDTISARLPNDALMSHDIMRTSTSNFSFNFIFSCLSHGSTPTETISYLGLGQTGTDHALLSGATSSQWKQGGLAARLFFKKKKKHSRIKLMIFRLHKATLLLVVWLLPGGFSVRAWLVMPVGGSWRVYVVVVEGVLGLVLLLVM